MTNQFKEIIWNLVNSLLAGSLVLLGAFTTGNISWASFLVAVGAGLIIAVNQFKDYWKSEEKEYCGKKLGAFL